jgi:hypothetical protein
MPYVVLRTHGGFGNQLFQLLYGRLFAQAQQCELREVHDRRYRHRFNRAAVPAVSLSPSVWQSAVSAIRIPKVLQRTLGQAEDPWLFFGVWFLDGYFQNEIQYHAFKDNEIRRQLDRLALELAIGPALIDTCLVHLRVGDFFGDLASARHHVINRLSSIPVGAHVMTNDEALLEEPEASALMAGRNVRLVSTTGFSAEEVLRTMARYRHIDANDSTLTVWAHVLAGTQVNFFDQRLSALAEYLGRLGPFRKKKII